MAGSERTPAGVRLSEKFDQPAGTGTWSDAGIEGSPEALAVLKEQGVAAWRAYVRQQTARKVLGRSRAQEAEELSEALARARPLFDEEREALRTDFMSVRAGNGNAGALRDYWTKGPGLAKWRTSPTPWRTLRKFLAKYLNGDELDSTTSSWYRIVFGALPQDR